MARTKQTTIKPKEMFKPYEPSDVPDIMPFPELALVATTKVEEIAVPRLNDHQRSWILDIGVRNLDLPTLKGKAGRQLYDQVKTNAFEAKAFQHTPQPQDRAEEALLPGLIADWKQKQRKNDKTTDKAAADDDEEDEGGRGGVLRGYTKAGWRLVSTAFTDLSRSSALLNNKIGNPEGY